MLFSPPLKRGINFAKIRGFKVTDYSVTKEPDGLSIPSRSHPLRNP